MITWASGAQPAARASKVVRWTFQYGRRVNYTNISLNVCKRTNAAKLVTFFKL